MEIDMKRRPNDWNAGLVGWVREEAEAQAASESVVSKWRRGVQPALLGPALLMYAYRPNFSASPALLM
jgi:hypothetical protein